MRDRQTDRQTDMLKEQGRIHGRTVAEGWAGAVMQNRLQFRNVMDRQTGQWMDGLTDGRTDRLTQQGVESRVRD